MKNNFFYQKPFSNIYAKPSIKSEITTQILYGEKIKILSKRKNWLKIKTDYDNYVGFLKHSKLMRQFCPSFKVYKAKTRIFKKIRMKFIRSEKFLFFASRIVKKKSYNGFIEFEKNMWIKKRDLKPIKFCEKKFSKILKLFINSRYKWGGKTSNGIDCSALVQIYFFFNNIYFPRDTKDQIKFIRKTKKYKIYKKDSLLYWEGHVAVLLNKNTLIHAYGPKKKVVIMEKIKTIREIKKNTNLDLKIL